MKLFQTSTKQPVQDQAPDVQATPHRVGRDSNAVQLEVKAWHSSAQRCASARQYGYPLNLPEIALAGPT